MQRAMPARNTQVISDFTSALAQLLVNPALCETFVTNPDAAADLLNLSPAERTLFVTLSATQLKRQAQLLISKRMRAAFEQLPLTVKSLGVDSASYFKEYAQAHWPNTYRRHNEDALHFCQFLCKHGLVYNQSEYNRIRFRCTGQRLRVCLAKDTMVNGKLSLALQVLYRTKTGQGEWRIYFKA